MILLTGASGYLGRHVLQKLEDRGLPYMATSRSGHVGTACDLLDPGQVESLLERVNPDVIIHCAANVPKRLEDYHDKASAFDSMVMANNVIELTSLGCSIVVVDSLASINPASAYAIGKGFVGYMLRAGDVSMMLPGLFGLPRRNGRMYRYAQDGTDYGQAPAMHVSDAAEYLVRATIRAMDDRGSGECSAEPFRVTYGNERLVATYGPLDHTFESRVRALVEQVRG